MIGLKYHTGDPNYHYVPFVSYKNAHQMAAHSKFTPLEKRSVSYKVEQCP